MGQESNGSPLGDSTASKEAHPKALFSLSLESSVTGRRPSATQEAGENEAASEKAVTEEVNMAHPKTSLWLSLSLSSGLCALCGLCG